MDNTHFLSDKSCDPTQVHHYGLDVGFNMIPNGVLLLSSMLLLFVLPIHHPRALL